MSRRRRIYEGKAKVLFEGPEPGTLVQYFKDDASASTIRRRAPSPARASSITVSPNI
jgi:phosphoribosylaminoimidazole-succinocarboxamide synthase